MSVSVQRRVRRAVCPRWLLVACALALALANAAGPHAAAQPKNAAPEPATPIPVPQIAQRAEEVAALLRQNAQRLAPSAEIQAIEARLPEASAWVRGRFDGTLRALAGAPPPSMLDNIADSWRAVRVSLSGWNDTLTRHATLLELALDELDGLRETWSASRREGQDSRAPASVIERIDGTLAAIAGARQFIAQQRAHVLALQDRIAKDVTRSDDMLARVAQTRAELAGPLLGRDSLPMWSPEARTRILTDVRPRLRESLRDTFELPRQFMAGQVARVPFHLAFFATVLAVMYLARRRARRRTETESSLDAAAQVFETPVSSALVLALLATNWIYPQGPRALHNLLGVLVLLPSVLIVRRLVARSLVPAVYALAAFFLADRIRERCSVVPVLEHWVFLVEMIFGIVFLALVFRSRELLTEPGEQRALGWRQLVRWLLGGMLAMLSTALFAGALGYMRLARLLGGSVLVSTYLAMVLYAGVQIAQGLVSYLFRARPLRRLRMVQRHRALLQRRAHLGLRALAISLWAYVTLDVLGLWTPIVGSVDAALGARFTRGAVSISLGDLLAFGLTLAAAVLISALARFALEEDVYPRLDLARGLPYALSSLVHYLILVVGFMFAVAALGFDLNRITIVAGALGVGVGIGLQNVVANFVSGLILLLEQRIHVGDSIQIGELGGEVRQIGIRSSTIRTSDGAEVIVPNNSLTADLVTNWTLSDRLRRINLQVGVAYSADPRRVLEILREVARAHPTVLPEPAPLVLCTGFGDSALNFELRVWTARFEESLLIRSELAVAVHAALAAAKIEIPFPQRDVRIRRAEDDRPDALPRERAD